MLELWCWRGLLKVPWTARRLNLLILKEISPEYSLQELMLKLKLKLQCFDHRMWKTDSFEKTLILGKIEGRRRRGWQRMRCLDGIHWLNGHEFGQALKLVINREAWCAAVHGIAKSQTWLSDWSELNCTYFLYPIFPCFSLSLPTGDFLYLLGHGMDHSISDWWLSGQQNNNAKYNSSTTQTRKSWTFGLISHYQVYQDMHLIIDLNSVTSEKAQER